MFTHEIPRGPISALACQVNPVKLNLLLSQPRTHQPRTAAPGNFFVFMTLGIVPTRPLGSEVTSHNVFIDSFLDSHPPHKIVNLLFTSTSENAKLTVLWGGRLAKTD